MKQAGTLLNDEGITKEKGIRKKKQLVGITEEGSAGDTARLSVSKHDRNDKLGRWRN